MMENQSPSYPGVMSLTPPARIGRVNWTQTTSITLATFIGCLVALAAAFYIFQYMLSKKVAQKTNLLKLTEDQLEHEEGLLSEVMEERKSIQLANQRSRIASAVVVTTAPKKEPEADATGTQEADDENPPE